MKVPYFSKTRHYSHFLHEHRQHQSNLMPEKVIIRRGAITAIFLLVITSINPTGYIFGESSFATEASSFLSAEDREFNALSQLIATEEGFLVKSMPQQQESVIVERLDFVDHEVQRGESLETIADMYDLSPETLVWENSIVNVESISIGDRLRIPPADGVSHEVRQGDTLLAIAIKYDVDMSRIERYNHRLESRGLRPGDNLFIPGGKMITTQLIAQHSDEEIQDEPVDAPTRVANIQTDVEATIVAAPRPTEPDAIPSPEIAPIQGVQSSRSIIRDADPAVRDVTIESGDSPIPDTPAPPSVGQWGKPTVGNVTQGFRRGHFAIDIANRSRPPIWATASGVVEVAGWGGAYGNYIIIDHQNGYKTLYAHNSDLYVKVGDRVEKGQVIAQMGNTGRVFGATGIHLHYECHHNGTRINPYNCME